MSGWPLFVLLAMASAIGLVAWRRRGEPGVEPGLSEPDVDFDGDD